MTSLLGGGEFNDWALISQSPLPPALWLLAIVAVLGSALASALAYWRAGGRRRWLALLNLAVAFAVVVLIAQPAIDLRATRRLPGRVAVVLDDSASMAELEDDAQVSRFALVEKKLQSQDSALQQFAEDHVIEYYGLNGVGRPTAPTLPRSDLLVGVERVFSSERSARPLEAVVLLSDGADSEALGRAADGDTQRELLASLKAHRVPINAVFVGGAHRPDGFIRDVKQDPLAFVRNTAKIEVVLGVVGTEEATTTVSLEQLGQSVAQRTVTLSRRAPTSVSFELVPDQVGEFIYTVKLSTLPDEAVLQNNRRDFVLRVVRDKIRALLVSGRPSWEERFIRRALRTSPNVDLISFFILRTPIDPQNVPQQELSLIPFPTRELFDTELHTFDVVILQNFDYRPYNVAFLLPNLRTHVMNGGALVMWGGESSFGGSAYGTTALADILPVRMSSGDVDASSYTPQVTAAGAQHPVLRWGQSRRPRQAAIDRLPKLEGLSHVDGLAEGAQALLVHPTVKAANGSPAPIVAVREVGRGRTMAVMSDSLWKWAFTDRMRGETGQDYERFMAQSLRWLMRDPEDSRLRVSASRDKANRNERIDFAVRVLGSDYLASKDVLVSAEIDDGGQKTTLSGATNAEGVWEFSRQAERAGVLRATVSAQLDDEVLSAETLVSIDDADAERAALSPRDDLLQQMAELSDGKFVVLNDFDLGALEMKPQVVVAIDKHREIPLWSTTAALVLVLVLLSLHWLLRRRAGFV